MRKEGKKLFNFKFFPQQKLLLLIIFFLVFLFFILPLPFLSFSVSMEKKVKNFDVSLVDKCEKLMAENNLPFAFCTIRNNELVLGSDSDSLKVGDYFGFQLNLTKLYIPFDTYYACVFTNLPRYDTSFPASYGSSEPEIILSPYFSCSPVFSKKDYHNLAISSFLIEKGEYKIVVYAFNGSLPSDFDFVDNIENTNVAKVLMRVRVYVV